MDDSRSAGGARGLEPGKLVEMLGANASPVPDVQVLAGFLGKSTREGYWRLYLTITLNEYVEFAEDDALHSRPLGRKESALGGTVVWVRRGTNLQRTQSVSREAQADFLHGDITAGFLSSSAVQRISPAARGFTPWLKAACLTGGDLETLCAACTAVPTALVIPEIRRVLGMEP